jgi:hypothetical protein
MFMAHSDSILRGDLTLLPDTKERIENGFERAVAS